MLVRWLMVAVLATGSMGAAVAEPEAGLRAQRIQRPIKIDGRLDEAAWAQAPVATNFTQEWPQRGTRPLQHTEVRILYDARYLYVGARMHHDRELDGGRASIVRRLHRRDQDSSSDWFSVALDSNHDHRTALLFEVNAAGVQKDQMIYNDATFNASWDGVWESAVSVDADGWTAELKIPLSLLRFKLGAGPQTWGANFTRVDQGRNRETSRWMVVPRGGTGYVSHFRELQGLEGLEPQPRNEYIPYVSEARKFETTRPFDDRRWTGRTGLDAHWSLNSHAQVDLALKPDFGQVEVDQTVLNLSTVETFFPEKRPFFLEGMDLFRVAGPDLFYSRRIGQGLADPTLNAGETLRDRPTATEIRGAAKYTSKYENGLNVGLLGASVAPAFAEIQDAGGGRFRRELTPLTTYAVLRAQQMLDDRGSYLGGFMSDMHQAGPTGRLAQAHAVDGAYQTQDHSGLVEVTLSHTDAGVKGAQEQGWRGRFRVHQEWRGGWALEFQAIDTGRAYNPNDLGYLSRSDDQRLYADVSRTWDQTWGIFRNWSLGVSQQLARDQAGHTFLRSFNSRARTDFTNFFSIWGNVGVNAAAEDDRELRTYADPVKKYLARPSLPFAGVGFDTAANRPYYLRITSNRSWPVGGPTSSGSLLQVVKPTPELELQLSTSLTRETGDERWLATPLATPIVGLRRLSQFNQTLRVAYAFTPTLSLQLFSQWLDANWAYRDLKHYVDDHTLTTGLPLDQPIGTLPATAFSFRSWTLNVITRWEFRPGSTFFLVYTHGVATDRLLNDQATLSPGPDLGLLSHLPSDDVVQAKLSWMFR